MINRKEGWIADARNLLIESVMREIGSTHSFEDLNTQLYCACAKFGLLYNSKTKEEVKLNFLNIVPSEKNFKEFKESLMANFKDFLEKVIK